MDPTACAQLILQCVTNNDDEGAAEACANLSEWASRGGFRPSPGLLTSAMDILESTCNPEGLPFIATLKALIRWESGRSMR